MFSASGALDQPENKVSWLVWSPRCSAPGRAGPEILLCLNLPSPPRKMDYLFPYKVC